MPGAAPLRIAHAYKVYQPDVYGGIPSAINTLCNAFPKAEMKSRIIACRSAGLGDQVRVGGVVVHRATSFGTLQSLPIAPTWPLLFWQKSRAADIVAVHTPFPLADLAVATHFPDRAGLVVHWHSDIVTQQRIAALLTPFTAHMLRRADAIIVSNPALMNSRYLAGVRNKVSVIPFGVDVAYWTAPFNRQERDQANALRATYPRLVVSVGRLVPYKGFDVLIDAMRRIDGHLLIVGEGRQRHELERRIAGAGLSGRAMLCGSVTASTLRAILRSADVFALPSTLPNETFGIAQLEAMACGRPVVNTELPTGVPWVARDGMEALTVPPGNADALAAAISRLLDDRSLAARLGAAGQERAETQFSLYEFAYRVGQFYAHIAATRHRAAHTVPPLALTGELSHGQR